MLSSPEDAHGPHIGLPLKPGTQRADQTHPFREMCIEYLEGAKRDPAASEIGRTSALRELTF